MPESAEMLIRSLGNVGDEQDADKYVEIRRDTFELAFNYYVKDGYCVLVDLESQDEDFETSRRLRASAALVTEPSPPNARGTAGNELVCSIGTPGCPESVGAAAREHPGSGSGPACTTGSTPQCG